MGRITRAYALRWYKSARWASAGGIGFGVSWAVQLIRAGEAEAVDVAGVFLWEEAFRFVRAE